MALDRHPDAAIAGQPGGLGVERRPVLVVERIGIEVEEDPVGGHALQEVGARARQRARRLTLPRLVAEPVILGASVALGGSGGSWSAVRRWAQPAVSDSAAAIATRLVSLVILSLLLHSSKSSRA